MAKRIYGTDGNYYDSERYKYGVFMGTNSFPFAEKACGKIKEYENGDCSEGNLTTILRNNPPKTFDNPDILDSLRLSDLAKKVRKSRNLYVPEIVSENKNIFGIEDDYDYDSRLNGDGRDKKRTMAVTLSEQYQNKHFNFENYPSGLGYIITKFNHLIKNEKKLTNIFGTPLKREVLLAPSFTTGNNLLMLRYEAVEDEGGRYPFENLVAMKYTYLTDNKKSPQLYLLFCPSEYEIEEARRTLSNKKSTVKKEIRRALYAGPSNGIF